MGWQLEGKVVSKQSFCFILFCFVSGMGALITCFCVDGSDSVVRENLMRRSWVGVGAPFLVGCS